MTLIRGNRPANPALQYTTDVKPNPRGMGFASPLVGGRPGPWNGSTQDIKPRPKFAPSIYDMLQMSGPTGYNPQNPGQGYIPNPVDNRPMGGMPPQQQFMGGMGGGKMHDPQYDFGNDGGKLFGGGNAKLVMTGDEILDSGVQVMAQPPGKKNATIHLLSGGEKALTATALVFSMFRLNPAPFCLLDEVDAPLDEHNVGRFCDIVREMHARGEFAPLVRQAIGQG